MIKFDSKISKPQYLKLLLALYFVNRSFLVFSLIMLVVSLLAYLIGATLFAASAIILLVLMNLAGFYQAFTSSFSSRSSSIFEPVRFNIDDQGVATIRNGNESKILWGQFTKYRSISGFMVLYITAVSFIVIPLNNVPKDKYPLLDELVKKNIQPVVKDLEYYKKLTEK